MADIMSLFKLLKPMTREQAIAAADVLQAGGSAAVRIDPRPAFILFLSSADRGLPYELDFVVTGEDMSKSPTVAPSWLPMTRQQRVRLARWTTPTIRLIITVWKERHPPH